MSVYLDNSATTKPCQAAVKKALEMMERTFGNPSSLHMCGIEAKKELDEARRTLSKFLSCNDSEIYFTSGGTAANNTAIFGTARAKRREGKKIVTTLLEHPSVLKHFELLESLGFEAVYLKPDKNGKVSLDSISNAVDANTVLVSIMAVNNEVGSIQEISKIKEIINNKKSAAYFHCDAVQAFGKIPLSPRKLGIDLMSISGHKIHGIKGAGALFVDRNVRLLPSILGGGQENGLISGTEPMPAICAFAAAVNDIGNIEKNLEKATELRDYFLEKIKNIDGITLNSPSDALPYIINISVKGVPSQVMLNALSAEGIYVSAGSACSKGHRSGVLSSMGVNAAQIDSAVRISLSKSTDEKDMDLLYNGIADTVKRVRRK
ncbi:MAG: cysteine desulfurase [Oscillospiraceae bacterium]|nr:cysteine desulfurase [Oscillospiraceae bacterium]